MVEYEPKNLDALLQLLNFRTKRQAELHARSLLIHGDDLSALFTASRVGGLGPYKYANRFSERRLPHFNPKQPELAAPIKVGPLEGDGARLFRKFFQAMEERRVFAAHLFYTPDHKFWHIFYFDQRDLDEHHNHWARGPHIHYANDIFHRAPLEIVWARVCQGDAAFLKPLHIRFEGWPGDA